MKKRLVSAVLAAALALTLLLTLAQADSRVEVSGIEGGSASVTASEDDSAALLEGYLYQLNGLEAPETAVKTERSGNTASRPATYAVALNATTKKIYDKLVPEIRKIANGKSDSSIIEVTGLDITYTKGDLELDTLVAGQTFTEETMAAVGRKFNGDVSADTLLTSLITHLPYELYWFDKVSGISTYYEMAYEGNGTDETVTIPSVEVTFYVADAYRDTTKYLVDDNNETVKDENGDPVPDYTAVDIAKTGAAKAAAAKAAEVVKDHQSKSTYGKLTAYREFITEAVDYNTKAATDKNYPYGDPWQLIYVFDDNTNTDVVCEGYAKAFKYLCDLTWTDSDPEVACYLVTGTMDGGTGEGAHMWNIVSVDGANYLTDITNCDSGTVGAPDKLFLCGAAGNVDTSYAVTVGDATVTYVYDDETKSIYDTELKLSAAKYSPLTFSLNQLTALARYAAGITTDKSAAIDVNKDGIISAADLTAMAQSLAPAA